jgi:hypothetical protein
LLPLRGKSIVEGLAVGELVALARRRGRAVGSGSEEAGKGLEAKGCGTLSGHGAVRGLLDVSEADSAGREVLALLGVDL